MTHQLPELPYAKDALAPHISAETIDFHYGKHHKTYVDILNKFLAGNPLEKEQAFILSHAAALSAGENNTRNRLMLKFWQRISFCS